MTPHRTSTGIAALDELGRRMDAIVEPPRLRRLRPRRWTAVALGILALVATPALASVSGIFDGAEPIERTFPEVAAAMKRGDPEAVGTALEKRGFRVHWILVTDNPDRARGGELPTRSQPIAAPPAGTKILSTLDDDGSSFPVSGDRDLLIEVAPADSAILRTHR